MRYSLRSDMRRAQEMPRETESEGSGKQASAHHHRDHELSVLLPLPRLAFITKAWTAVTQGNQMNEEVSWHLKAG